MHANVTRVLDNRGATDMAAKKTKSSSKKSGARSTKAKGKSKSK